LADLVHYILETSGKHYHFYKSSLSQAAFNTNAQQQTTSSKEKRREKKLAKVTKLCQDHRFNVAMSIVEDLSLDPDLESQLEPPAGDQSVFLANCLDELNPPASELDDLSRVIMEKDISQIAPLVIKADLFMKIIDTVNRGSSPGPMGWTFRLISQMVRKHRRPLDFCHLIVSKLLNPMLAGKLNPELWTTSRAVLIPKKSSGFRPLAIGDSWYRLMARAAMRLCGEEVGEKLRPYQLGCGTKGGAEIAARIAQLVFDEGFENFPETAIVTFDIKNAFGTMPRGLMLRGILKHCEDLAPWFLWAYGGDGLLVDNQRRRIATNATGCRQGDPLAGLCFCLGLQEALEEGLSGLCQDVLSEDVKLRNRMRERDGMPRVQLASSPLKDLVSAIHGFLAYMDDLTFYTHSMSVGKVITGVVDILKGFGLQVNVTKTKIILCNEASTFNPSDCPEVASIKNHEECLEILGAPIGELMACRNWLCESLGERILPLARGLRDVNPAAAFNLLRYCLNTKASYVTRVLEPSISFGPLSFFDVAIDGILLQIMGLLPSHLQIKMEFEDDHLYSHSSLDGRIDIALLNLRELRDLPIRLGGFGIVRHCGVFGDSAVAASRACTASFLGKVPFGDFIRDRVQTKWLAEDKRILIGGKRRCALFDLATDETFCRTEITYHKEVTRCHYSPGDRFSQDFDEPS
jgi:hypothetical protein